MILKNALEWTPSDRELPMKWHRSKEPVGVVNGIVIVLATISGILGTLGSLIGIFAIGYSTLLIVTLMAMLTLDATLVLYWLNRNRIEESVEITKELIHYRFSDIRGVNEWVANRSDYFAVACEEYRLPRNIWWHLHIYLVQPDSKRNVDLFRENRISSYRNLSEHVNRKMEEYAKLFGVSCESYVRKAV